MQSPLSCCIIAAFFCYPFMRLDFWVKAQGEELWSMLTSLNPGWVRCVDARISLSSHQMWCCDEKHQQHFPFIFSGTSCGPAATVVDVCGDEFCCRPVRRLEWSQTHSFGRCSPLHVAATKHVSRWSNRNGCTANYSTRCHIMGPVTLISWVC